MTHKLGLMRHSLKRQVWSKLCAECVTECTSRVPTADEHLHKLGGLYLAVETGLMEKEGHHTRRDWKVGEGKGLSRVGLGEGKGLPASKCPAHACDAARHPAPQFRPAGQLCTRGPPLLSCAARHRPQHEAAAWHRLHAQTHRPQTGAWPLPCP